MYNAVYESSHMIYSVDDGILDIGKEWIFLKMLDYNWDIAAYSYNDNYVDLFGDYPKNKIIKIKKFFHDNYPFTSIVEPRKYGVRIHFKTIVTLN